MSSKDLLASATDASAYAANLLASSYYLVASDSSLATTFYVSSASCLSIFNFSIIFNVSILAYSNFGYMSFKVILISSTASLAATNLSSPPLSLKIDEFKSFLFSANIDRYIYNNSKYDVGVT